MIENHALKPPKELYCQALEQNSPVFLIEEQDQSLEGWSDMSWIFWSEAGDCNFIWEKLEKKNYLVFLTYHPDGPH